MLRQGEQRLASSLFRDSLVAPLSLSLSPLSLSLGTASCVRRVVFPSWLISFGAGRHAQARGAAISILPVQGFTRGSSLSLSLPSLSLSRNSVVCETCGLPILADIIWSRKACSGKGSSD